MSLKSILRALPEGAWIEHPNLVTQHRGTLQLSQQESRSLSSAAAVAIKNRDVIGASNNLFAGLVLDEARFLAKIQKDGILRISRFSYAPEPLNSIVKSLLLSDLGLSQESVSYLNTVLSLYRVAESVLAEYQNLEEWLARERETGVRGALGTVDFLFLKRCFSSWAEDPLHSSRDWTFHSVEGIAAGLSSILALYFEKFGPLRGNVVVDAEAVFEDRYLKHLLVGAHIAQFREWEFQIDRFGYRLRSDGIGHTFRLTAPSEEFHRAVEFGYIQHSLQRTAKGHLWHDPQAMSFIDLGQQVTDKFMVYVAEPLPRFRCEFPEPVFSLVAELQTLTQEEQKTVAWACREMIVSAEELLKFDLGNGVTMHDLFKVSRLVNFMHGVVAKKLVDEVKEQPIVVINSLVPALPMDRLKALIGNIVDSEKVDEVLEMLLLKSDGHVDILYRPMIPAGDTVLLPLHMFSQSNVYRNPLVVTQRRLFPDGKSDPLTQQVGDSFKMAGAAVATNISYSTPVSGQCDVAALLDGYLFVCECKNSLLPTDMHELQTSIDYIGKACEQLSRFSRCFENADFRRKLSSKIGREISEDVELVPAIIVSNRMMLGWRPEGIPVRGNEELCHFIERGTVEIGIVSDSKDSGQEARFWKGESLSVLDLVRFFRDHITYQPQWNALELIESTFEFSESRVTVSRYRMNFISLAGNFGLTDLKQALIEKAREAGMDVAENGEITGGEGV